jgi:pimeloyl-ACP methyl ester carboxylesterase
MPVAQLEILPGGGHMLMLEQPEKVAQSFKAFLDSL